RPRDGDQDADHGAEREYVTERHHGPHARPVRPAAPANYLALVILNDRPGPHVHPCPDPDLGDRGGPGRGPGQGRGPVRLPPRHPLALTSDHPHLGPPNEFLAAEWIRRHP